MLWNGVSSTPRLRAHRCRKPSSSSSTAAAAAAPSRGGGQNQYSARQPSRCTCQGRPCAVDDRRRRPSVNRSASGIATAKSSSRSAGRERGPDRGQRERVAGQGAADAGDVDLVAEHRAGRAGRRPPRSCRTPPAGRRRRSACRPPPGRARAPTPRVQPPGPAQSVCVSSMTSSTPCRRVISRTAVEVARRRAARCRCWSAPAPSAGRRRRPRPAAGRGPRASLNGTTAVVTATSTCGPSAPGPRHDPVAVEHGERLVDGAVVAPVHHRDPRPAGQVPGEAQHEPVGVGRRHRELPARQPEPAGQLLADPGRVRRRQHRGDARRRPARRPPRRPAGSACPVIAPVSPRHRSTYSMPVDVGEPGARCADSTNSGKAPGQRVIHGIGTPASSGPRACSASSAERGCSVDEAALLVRAEVGAAGRGRS